MVAVNVPKTLARSSSRAMVLQRTLHGTVERERLGAAACVPQGSGVFLLSPGAGGSRSALARCADRASDYDRARPPLRCCSATSRAGGSAQRGGGTCVAIRRVDLRVSSSLHMLRTSCTVLRRCAGAGVAEAAGAGRHHSRLADGASWCGLSRHHVRDAVCFLSHANSRSQPRVLLLAGALVACFVYMAFCARNGAVAAFPARATVHVGCLSPSFDPTAAGGGFPLGGRA